MQSSSELLALCAKFWNELANGYYMVTFICCNPNIEEKVAILHLESTNDILKNLVMSCDKGAEAKKQLVHQILGLDV